MPIAVEDVLDVTKEKLEFALAPAQNAAHSLFRLLLDEELSGQGEWVHKTNRSMSAKLRETNRLVMEGFHGIATPDRDWPNFMDFADDLAAQKPEALRDRMLAQYLSKGDHKMTDTDVILASAENYLAFLYECYPPDHIKENIERQAYSYMRKPAAMQELIVDHLRKMWKTYLEPEWERVLPMLQSSVNAFRQVRITERDPLKFMRWVTGNDVLDDWWLDKIKNYDRFVFVPSAHVGPYLGRIFGERTLWVIFGARLPQGASEEAPDLSRTEIVVRMNALADDDRLRILRLIAERGEMKSPEIIKELDLSQSAASRHLMQLSATGFLSERRSNGAKAYQLNQTRFADTFEGLNYFLRVS